MHSAFNGFRITFEVAGIRDALCIPAAAVDTDADACPIALLAARHGYPEGAITITHIDTGTWCPTGGWANPEQTALYAMGY